MGSWGGKREGAGRKPKVAGEKRKALSVTVSERRIEQARVIAARTGQTLSEVVDAMLGLAAEASPYRELLRTESPLMLERVVPHEKGAEVTPDARPQR